MPHQHSLKHGCLTTKSRLNTKYINILDINNVANVIARGGEWLTMAGGPLRVTGAVHPGGASGVDHDGRGPDGHPSGAGPRPPGSVPPSSPLSGHPLAVGIGHRSGRAVVVRWLGWLGGARLFFRSSGNRARMAVNKRGLT